jgi:hypothetical protein
MNRILAACSLALTLGCSRPEPAPPAEQPPAETPSVAAVAPSTPTPPVSREPSEWRVSEEGIGPLQAGMPLAKVVAALDTTLTFPEGRENECVMTPLPGAASGTALMFVHDTLVRVDVFRSASTATVEGARIGDTRARIEALYPGRVRAGPHKYTNGQYLVVPAAVDTTYQFVFETDEAGKVTRYRAGRLPEVGWVEACS